MAQKIVVGLATYLEDFDGGQVGLRTGSYTQYATDLDTCFVTLRVTINQIIDELAAVQGPNAGLGVDILVFDDPERADSGEPNDDPGAQRTGFVGLASFEPAITTTSVANDSVTVDVGAIVIDGTVVRNGTGATKVGTGLLSGLKYIAIDLNGAIYLENTANQRSADLWEINWNGTAFTGSFVRQNQVFFDGDEYEAMRARPAAGSSPITFAARRYEAFHFRMEAVERILAGFATDTLGNALGQPALRAGTQGAPSLVFESDPDTGIFAGGANTWNVSTGGTSRLSVSTTAITAVLAILAIAGTAGAPGYAISGDTNTGMFGEAADTLGLATAGAQGFRLDPTGNVDLPLNSRVKGIAATQSITDNTPTLVDFATADEFDIGAWHDHASGTLATRQEFNLPAGAEGLYMIVASYEWAAPTNATDIIIEITIEGVAQPEKIEDQIPATENRSGQLVLFKVLATNDTVRMRVTQDDTGGAAALNLEAASLSIVKVA